MDSYLSDVKISYSGDLKVLIGIFYYQSTFKTFGINIPAFSTRFDLPKPGVAEVIFLCNCSTSNIF